MATTTVKASAPPTAEPRLCADPCCGRTLPDNWRPAYCSWRCRNADDMP